MGRRRHQPEELDSFAPLAVAADRGHVSIAVPVGDFHEERHKPLHVEVRLTNHQGRALQRLLNGLNDVYGAGWSPREQSFADVVRWLLDQLPG